METWDQTLALESHMDKKPAEDVQIIYDFVYDII